MGFPEIVIILLVWIVPIIAVAVVVIVMLRISKSIERMSNALEQIATSVRDRPHV